MTIRKIYDSGRFISAFNDENGDYIRTGILDENGNDTGIDPMFADFPQLLDIGIMGHCQHGLSGKCKELGIQCYQSGAYIDMPNMPFEDFKTIISQCEGRTFQVALGGRGDSEMHEDFENILSVCRHYGIVPNTTTSGYGLDNEKVKIIKRYCGAVAVSWYKTEYTYKAINMLLDAGVTTNIHFVLGQNSIDEAIDILSKDLIPKGISRFIFLLHKPVGMGDKNRILRADDIRIKKFFDLLSDSYIAERTGFDSCLVPGIIKNCINIMPESFDACEAGRFSAYIGADMMMSPCSFDRQNKVSMSLKEYTIKEVWDSPEFSKLREFFEKSCQGCYYRSNCLGGCPYYPEIRLCKEGV
ncbi:SPASM domain-containing protein [Clostridium sp. SYSU_GA19001]|uniref:radical SAM protein n=1 Tax=Clostridium caldaquaticum TaxID=2940653 RepID=UPI0020770937|nr:SPASM domain-containing protein [Clostridium caldaquaticum]MCM8710119.1 SPASM domain-containing protein [Clostridium caldaquaticum]